ncbi:MAG: matrixin family metalloprotease [Euryarchaeota archaeon]|nr:matrixin family metalloprotease [Euryarchaeota archaeon]MCG2735064.1 matrixin family metalloprotease [Candidatus Methanoperedenaceae archaeon]
MAEKESRGDKNNKIIILVFIATIPLIFIMMSIIASPESLIEPLKGHPWNKSNLNIYIDIIGIPVEEVDVYTYNALLAFRGWESKEGMRRLGYQVNFTQVYNQKDANINIKWTEILYNDDNIQGHTYINTSPTAILGFQLKKGVSGDQSCDAINPPFTLCNITIKLGLSNIEMQKVIRHEIGHAFGLEESFTGKDFIVYWSFSNDPDIMFIPALAYLPIIPLIFIILLIGIKFAKKRSWQVFKK